MGSAVRQVVWASTALDTRGGVSSSVRSLLATPLGPTWSVVHIPTHRDASAVVKAFAFARGALAFTAALARRPALVHLHTASYGSFARKATLAALARAARTPVVLHVHGAEFHLFHDRAPAPVRHLIRRTLHGSVCVVALGEVWARRLRRIAPDARVVVVPNAVDVPATSTWDAPAPGPVEVVFLGRVDERKGAPVLIEAWAKAAPGPGVARLVLAGDGDLDGARALARELGVADSVEIRRWLSPEQVRALLDRAQVLVLSSRAEGQPIAVLEAMAHGLCVIGSPAGGMPEMLGDGCGMVVEPDDPAALAEVLRTVLTDSDLRRRTGERARDRVRSTYDTAVVWRRFDAIYREVTRG